MSRTPEIITDKRAADRKSNLYGYAFFSGFIAWVCFEADSNGAGLIFSGLTLLLFWIAGKIKTKLYKTTEAARYVRR